MQERLSKVVGRTENIITPVEGDDIFPILHRRLFTSIGPLADRRAVADAYANWYESLSDAVPARYREASYRDRMAAAFPFHPELVDILTNQWGSLAGFQRTRGALRTLAHTVKALSQRRHQAPLIHPGDVALADPGIRAEVLRFAGESYKAALNADIIRPDSIAPAEDRRRGGIVESEGLATGLASTAFLNSFSAGKVQGASAAQMLIGVGRPGLSRGLIEDVRDSLEASLWYMRLEGGRYRFTTEPNLNKVILEREGAITDDRIETLLREAIGKVGPSSLELRVEPRVEASADLPDNQQLTLGVLDFSLRIGTESSDATLRTAREILDHRGAVWRSNKNAALLIAADAPAMFKARATARTLAALRDLDNDKHRLNRFNAEQREQLAKRLINSEERLPQQVVMAYRHLLLLGPGNDGGPRLENIDLGPARADATISGRVLDYLRSTDRLVETTLAPAALLAARFSLLPEGTDAVELDMLLGFFYQLPRLPKLASPNVLRQALADGVKQGLFGLASGAAWDAEDSLLRFRTASLDPTEIQFQPGTWLVRGGPISEAIAVREPIKPSEGYQGGSEGGDDQEHHGDRDDGREKPSNGDDRQQPPGALKGITLRVNGIPASQARDVIKVAVLPLAAASPDVTVDVVIRAEGGMAGIPNETLNLVILEGLQQLGLHNVEVVTPVTPEADRAQDLSDAHLALSPAPGLAAGMPIEVPHFSVSGAYPRCGSTWRAATVQRGAALWEYRAGPCQNLCMPLPVRR
jgi:hypothetical protein